MPVSFRRVLTLLALVAAFVAGSAAPALAAQAWEEVRDRLVPLPPEFSELNDPGTLNGKVDLNQLFAMSGESKPKGLSDKELRELNNAGFARTMADREAGDVLVVMGFKASSSDEAGFMVEGMLDSARRNGQFTEDPAASTREVHVYTLQGQGATGQAAVIRKGNYAYMFLVAGNYGPSHQGLAKTLAQQQLQALPAGSTEVGGDETSMGAVIGVLVFALLVVGLVVFLIVRASRRSKAAVAAGAPGVLAPAEGGPASLGYAPPGAGSGSGGGGAGFAPPAAEDGIVDAELVDPADDAGPPADADPTVAADPAEPTAGQPPTQQ